MFEQKRMNVENLRNELARGQFRDLDEALIWLEEVCGRIEDAILKAEKEAEELENAE